MLCINGIQHGGVSDGEQARVVLKLKLGKSAQPQGAAKPLPSTLSHYTDLRGIM